MVHHRTLRECSHTVTTTMRNIVIIMLLGLMSLTTSAKTTDTSKELIVGVTPISPFVMKNPDGNWSGISVDLWRNVATTTGLTYKFVQVDLQTNISKVTAGEFDVGIGAISITAEREKYLDFSQPYYGSGLGIVTTTQVNSSAWDVITNPKLLKTVMWFFIFVISGGILILIFENGAKNEEFRMKKVNNGVWWSIVTITTTGYGDLVPKTILGRLFAGTWMVIGAIVVPILIGSMSATLTNEQYNSVIRSASDLTRHKVAVIKNTTAHSYFEQKSMDYVVVDSIDQLLSYVEDGKVQGGVYDAPILKYYTKDNSKLVVLPDRFHLENYGMILPTDSNIRELINVNILLQTSSSGWLNIIKQYIGAANG